VVQVLRQPLKLYHDLDSRITPMSGDIQYPMLMRTRRAEGRRTKYLQFQEHENSGAELPGLPTGPMARVGGCGSSAPLD